MGPVRCRVWRDGAVVEEGVHPDDLAARVHDPSCLVWIDLVDPSPEALSTLAAEIGLGKNSVEDALAPLERPKVTRHAEGVFFMTYATTIDSSPDEAALRDRSVIGGRLRLARVSGYILGHALVTIRTAEGFDIDPVLARWDDNAELLRFGPGALAHGLLDAVVDGHFETIQALDDAIEDLEDELFAEQARPRNLVQRAYGVRKDLVRLRRVVLPMREVVNGMLRHRSDEDSQLARWYDDLYDHVLRAAEWTESLRDMVSTVFETNLSLQDMRLNTVMKRLAGWAAIIAVPTAITGWFGQNLPYPGFGHTLGLWLSVVSILGISGGLYLAFKRRDWL